MSKATHPPQKRRAVKRATTAPAIASSPAPDTPNTAFPVVGIGASAGGIEALEQFLSPVPPASGLAFVVVQQYLVPQYLDRPSPARKLHNHIRLQRLMSR